MARIKIRKMCKQQVRYPTLGGRLHSGWPSTSRGINRFSTFQWWFWLVIIMVFFNTCTVALEHYGQPQWLEEFLRECSNCGADL